MPWWAIIYLGLFITINIAGSLFVFREEFEKGRRIQWVLDFVIPVIWSYFFTAFWFHGLSFSLGLVAPILLALGFAWEAYAYPKQAHQTNADSELTRKEKRTIRFFGLIIEIPIFIVATIAVLRNYFH